MKYFKQLILLIIPLVYSQANVDLRSKVGQMIMVGFPGNEIPDSLQYDIENRNLGGVVTLGWNLENPDQIKQLTSDFQALAQTPLLIAIDQEGGYVARLGKLNGFKATLPAYTLGTEINHEDSTRNQAALMASWLRESGFNVNLAPVADVNVNPNSPAIGLMERSFSENSTSVAHHTSWFIDEFNKQGILTTLKHYPGHGNAADDSHSGFTDITNTWSNDELVPYEYLLNHGFSDLIMTGHLYNASIDSVYPATLSKATITNLLRDSLGFDGVVITDALNMGAIRYNYTFEETVELAINAGVDVLLCISNLMEDGQSTVGTIIDIVEEKAAQGIIAEASIDASYNRIMELKARQALISHISGPDSPQAPASHTLGVYPNPFNRSTTISVILDQASNMKVELLNIRGQLIRVLDEDYYEKGQHRLQLDGSQLTSGVYFLRQITPQQTLTIKVSLVK